MMLRQARGKLRRFLTANFRKEYLSRQTEIRLGKCAQCGKCCRLVFRCPFLSRGADGTALCLIYERRPGQCAAFPVDQKCLTEVNLECGYSFPGGPEQPVG